FRGVAAHDDDSLGGADVVVAVGHRAVAPGIGDAGDGRGVADTRLMVDVVRAPIGSELAVHVGTFVRALRGAKPVDRVRPGLLTDGLHLVADLVDRLIPGDAGPLPVDHLHRILQAAVAVHEFAYRRTLYAVGAAIDGAVPSRLLADPYPVRDLGGYRAADRAVRADILAHLDLGARRGRRAGFCLLHGAERQAAKRGETAGCKPRAAQKRTAVDAIRLSSESGGEVAAACFAFGSFDQ